MRRIVWARSALDDLDSAIGYIALDRPAAARRVADRIDKAVRSLETMPTGRPGRVLGTYEKVVTRTPYIVAYALDDSIVGAERVVVLRVIHGARDWQEGRWPQGA